MQKLRTQADWIALAQKVLPASTFGNFEGDIVIARGAGALVWDADGRDYVDYLIGSGPMLLGHGHPEVMEAVLEQLPLGQTFFANNTLGIEMAAALVDAVPCADQVRFMTSGGEANMYAVRAARAYTGKDKVLKFEGGYHGMSPEALMSMAPAEPVNFPIAVPDGAGFPQSVADQMLIAPFNDLEAVESLLAEHDDVAAIIVEPIQRIISPLPGYLAGLRTLADKYGVLLIFDEVVTGFRLAYGGAQEFYGVAPDLCALGKVIGGGFALGALAGRADIMGHFDKSAVGADKFLMHHGTLAGSPVAAAAGLKTLEILKRDGQIAKLRETGVRLQKMMSDALEQVGIAHQICGDPTLFDLNFTDAACTDYRNARHRDPAQNALWNQTLRDNGIFKSPGKVYPCLALTEEHLQRTEAAVQIAAKKLAA